MAIKRHKLDLISLSILLDVDHGTDISRFEPFAGDWRIQDHPIVFFNHD
jgi:hypothetical protein